MRWTKEDARDAHRVLTTLLEDTFEKKNDDYSHGSFDNFRLCERWGIPALDGVLVRMSDKLQRAGVLLRKEPSVTNESLRDTLLDLANYALIAVLLMEEDADANRA
jgi:hypothetical protein